MSLRTLARVCIALFALSTAFPVVAGVLNMEPPLHWLGITDVAVAALLFVAVATLVTRARKFVAGHHQLVAFSASQMIINIIPLLLVVYFIAGSRINWAVVVVGLGWRAWLLFICLPSFAAALYEPERQTHER